MPYIKDMVIIYKSKIHYYNSIKGFYNKSFRARFKE
ncbi:hypothetical protein HNP67_001200 [Borreliella californiensis]|uniref:Uncharacterized protein n=1 Tax=Borreliella californiensis TaxID=373543 RepID=A0A7X0DQ38_9SPIR|nr:hypothetical protein [Borreliella californiensis]